MYMYMYGVLMRCGYDYGGLYLLLLLFICLHVYSHDYNNYNHYY